MLEEFNKEIKDRFSFLQKASLLVACSGGVDSMVLTHLCVKSGFKIILVHCNFNLRGKESDEDEQFVRRLANQLKVEVLVKSFDTKHYTQNHKGSIQMAARTLRYEWFAQLAAERKIDYILTAHHLDDSLETFLINLSRGTGIDGLSGIPAQNDKIVRPLISFSRAEILQYAKNENFSWREDSSNTESKYLRNKIRLEITPKLKELQPAFLKNFKQTQTYLAQTNSLVQNHTDHIKENLFKEKNGVISIDIEALSALKPQKAYLYQLFKEYGFKEWDDVSGLLTAMSGKEIHSTTHRLVKDRTDLILSTKETKSRQTFLIEKDELNATIPIPLTIEEVEIMEKGAPNVVFLDKEKLNYPLILRNWQKGDYFYPSGMKGKKKLSKFFKDEKVDVLSKEKQWLLCSGEHIVWVIGRRSDERYKVDDSTKNILKITCSV